MEGHKARLRYQQDTRTQLCKLSLVVDQVEDRETQPLEQAQLETAYPVYKVRMGDPRQPGDGTLEQLAALRALFSSEHRRAFDASLTFQTRFWVPMVHFKSGWHAGLWYNLAGKVSPSTLDRWVKKYEAEAGALSCQAEVRVRLEHTCHVRRDGASAKVQATAAGGGHPFNLE